MDVEFAKIDEDQRLVFGLASVAVDADGQVVTDLQDDQIPPAELEKAQYDYVLKVRRGGTMHEQLDTAELAESFVVTPEKLRALVKGLGIKVDADGKADLSMFKGVASWVGYKVTDPQTWARVKGGELRGFSIGGKADREAA